MPQQINYAAYIDDPIADFAKSIGVDIIKNVAMKEKRAYDQMVSDKEWDRKVVREDSVFDKEQEAKRAQYDLERTHKLEDELRQRGWKLEDFASEQSAKLALIDHQAGISTEQIMLKHGLGKENMAIQHQYGQENIQLSHDKTMEAQEARQVFSAKEAEKTRKQQEKMWKMQTSYDVQKTLQERQWKKEDFKSEQQFKIANMLANQNFQIDMDKMRASRENAVYYRNQSNELFKMQLQFSQQEYQRMAEHARQDQTYYRERADNLMDWTVKQKETLENSKELHHYKSVVDDMAKGGQGFKKMTPYQLANLSNSYNKTIADLKMVKTKGSKDIIRSLESQLGLLNLELYKRNMSFPSKESTENNTSTFDAAAKEVDKRGRPVNIKYGKPE